jgi:predicted alpha-1,6-mannanase (GH76 family)
MAAHWKQDGGGVMWCTEPDKQKTNSITNSLFLMLSSDLARLDPTPETKAWAERSHTWLVEQKVFDGTGVVDGPGHRGDYWSYNQGAYLAGLTAYAELTGSPGEAEEVAKVTEAILTRSGFVRDDGILIERLGTSGWDGCLFKGIMARHLRRTRDFLSAHHLHPETVAQIDRCLSETARAILALDTGKEGLFPAEWHPGAKNQERNFNTHLSALIALVAALPGK